MAKLINKIEKQNKKVKKSSVLELFCILSGSSTGKASAKHEGTRADKSAGAGGRVFGPRSHCCLDRHGVAGKNSGARAGEGTCAGARDVKRAKNLENIEFENSRGIKKEDILKTLSISETTFYKNIAKLKNAGFKIVRAGGRYSIENHTGLLELDEVEKSIIAYMKSIAAGYLSDFKQRAFSGFLKKFLYSAHSKDCADIEKRYRLMRRSVFLEEYSDKIAAFEIHIKRKDKLTITLRNKKEISLIPLSFDYSRDRAVLVYLNCETKRKERLALYKIVKISKDFEKKYLPEQKEVIFELSGKLSKAYLLREYERVVDYSADTLTVAASVQNKTVLFKRLLRYDTLCRVVQTRRDVEIFKSIIEKSIKNTKVI